MQEVAAHLAVGDAPNLQKASESLQVLSVQFARLMQTTPLKLADRKAVRARALALSATLQILRDNLSRQTAFTTQALGTLFPEPSKSTYSNGKSVYGSMRPNGAAYKARIN